MIRKKHSSSDLNLKNPDQPTKSAIELQGNSSSLRKLLSSHSSIYNALANPELDEGVRLSPQLSHSPKLSSRDFQNQLPDLQFSMTSWQSVSSGDTREDQPGAPAPSGAAVAPVSSPAAFSSKRPTSSILLSISDDNDSQLDKGDSTILIPYPKRVMVFETDEEEDVDEDDDKTLNVSHIPKKISSTFPKFPFPAHMNSPPSIPLESYTFDATSISGQDSFIMPTMSVSDNNNPNAVSCRSKRRKLKLKLKLRHRLRNKTKLDTSYVTCDGFQVSVLLTSSYQSDASFLIATLEDDLSNQLKSMYLRSYLVDQDISDNDLSNIRHSDLVFLINDGSFAFVEMCLKVFQEAEGEDGCEDAFPKISIINLITVNYFINLFDLINNLKPHQIWKASSLKATQLRSKLKEFIAGEIEDGDDASTLNNTPASASLIKKSLSSSITSTSTNSKKPNYKQIEKRFKNELQYSSPSLENVDPLFISNKFTYLNIMSSIFKNLQSTFDLDNYNYGKLWFLCSFSLGIGLGVGIANGATTIVGVSILGNEGKMLNSPDFMNFNTAPDVSLAAGSATKNAWNVVYKIGETCKEFKDELLDEITKSSLFLELKNIANLSASYLYGLNILLLDNVKGGLEKVFGLFMYINY